MLYCNGNTNTIIVFDDPEVVTDEELTAKLEEIMSFGVEKESKGGTR